MSDVSDPLERATETETGSEREPVARRLSRHNTQERKAVSQHTREKSSIASESLRATERARVSAEESERDTENTERRGDWQREQRATGRERHADKGKEDVRSSSPDCPSCC